MKFKEKFHTARELRSIELQITCTLAGVFYMFLFSAPPDKQIYTSKMSKQQSIQCSNEEKKGKQKNFS